MLEAHIVSPRGVLCYVGDADPYDLETLWQHLREASHCDDAHATHLDLTVGRSGIEPALAGWLWRIAAIGIDVQVHVAGGA
jgi:hypothetical protein